MLVVAAGGEGDLRQGEVVLSAGQRGVEHQDVALEHTGGKGLYGQSQQVVGHPPGPGTKSRASYTHEGLGLSEGSRTSPSLSRGGKWKKSD